MDLALVGVVLREGFEWSLRKLEANEKSARAVMRSYDEARTMVEVGQLKLAACNVGSIAVLVCNMSLYVNAERGDAIGDDDGRLYGVLSRVLMKRQKVKEGEWWKRCGDCKSSGPMRCLC